MTEKKKGLVARVVGDKRAWRDYRGRVRALPPSYRDAVEAIERYLLRFGVMDARNCESLFDDVATLFEQAAADAIPIRDVVGDDPVEFVESLIRNYSRGGYVAKEQSRLISAIERAEQAQGN